jgi:aryl-alcohol dehydrogenase-like predicted oxidoreductase
MQYRNVGRSGLLVSAIGLGCDNFGWRCDPNETAAIVQRAFDLGVNLFDTADLYGPDGLSEQYLGKALKGFRDDVILATKFVGHSGSSPSPLHMGSSRRHIMNAVEASLRRLDTDYIDLYQLHFPHPGAPIDETLRALDDLVRAGKVRYIGTSNFTGWQIADASWTARTEHLTRFVSAQNAYNLLDRQIEKELVPACVQHGVGILAYFALASGFLTGKYRPGENKPDGARLSSGEPTTGNLVGIPDAVIRASNPEVLRWVTPTSIFNPRNYEQLAKLVAFAQARDHTVLELAIAWLATRPALSSVLVGATRPEQVEQSARAAEWQLTDDEVAELDELTYGALYLDAVPRVL